MHMNDAEWLRFWDKVRIGDGCWDWQGSRVGGYGHFRLGGRRGHVYKAHRLAWVDSNGAIPPSLCICHSCDNRRCVRPSHLFLGTHQDNMADREAKGRNRPVRGERQGLSKLTELAVIDMRKRRSDGEVYRTIAMDYGVPISTVFDVVSRRTWKHVE